MLEKLQNNRNALGLLFMLPAAVLLLLFLTYPLGLGTWLGFTDAKVGRSGEWVGLENYAFLIGDPITQLALFNKRQIGASVWPGPGVPGRVGAVSGSR